MRQTVVGVFDRYAAAQNAAELLRQRGIDEDDIHLAASDDSSASLSEDRHEEGLLDKIKNFFSGDVDDDAEVSAYSEHVRRGGAVLKVDVEDEPEVDVAREVLQSAGAVDIDERVSEWKQSGWSSGTDTTATTTSAMAAGSARASGLDSRAETDQVIPVVREDVQIGKRTVKAGGVRVYSRMVEDQVHESVDLREERAHIERVPVDRPASEADLRALGDRSIEVEESVERPVVQKTARVVEEIRVGKDVRQQRADIHETVRHTEVDVQRSGADERMRAYADFEKDYRADFSTRFGARGRRYEEVEPAYRFGHSLAGDERYRSSRWEDVETQARSDWEQRNSGSAWDDMKDAVRHAWERAKS